jgi:nucleoside-diphosphate-sugar epimerase
MVSKQRPDVLIAGYGDLGSAIGQQLAATGLSVLGLRRSKRSHDNGVAVLTADVTRPETLACLKGAEPRILVYCVAADAASDDNYRLQYVDGLRHVLAALDQAGNLGHVFFVSSTRVYGQSGDSLLTESDPAMPADFGGERLLEAERLLAGLPCGHTALRLSGIYGPGRERMLSLAGCTEKWPQNNWSNRIHRDDAAAFVMHLIHRVLNGAMIEDCYIVTDSCPVPQHEVLHWLADRMGHASGPAPSPAPSGGKRLSNACMLASGFQLHYASYRDGYAALLGQADR